MLTRAGCEWAIAVRVLSVDGFLENAQIGSRVAPSKDPAYQGHALHDLAED